MKKSLHRRYLDDSPTIAYQKNVPMGEPAGSDIADFSLPSSIPDYPGMGLKAGKHLYEQQLEPLRAVLIV